MSEFDLRTHVRSAKGDITSKQPYRLKISNGKSLFERPVGSGNWYTQNGEQVQFGEAQAEKKPEYKVAELEAMLADVEAKLKAFEEEKKAQDVELAPVPLTQAPAKAQTKEVPKTK